MGIAGYRIPIRRQRLRLVIFGILVLVAIICRDVLRASVLLALTPLVWTLSPMTEHLRISRERDNFDITFKEYPEFLQNGTVPESPVPNIFHHILLGMKPKPGWEFARSECVRHHPGYKFEFWDDARAAKFLQTEFPDYYETWTNYRFPIQRADSLRYFIMYKYGGIFLDMDLQCMRSLSPLQQFEVVTPAAHPMGVSNGFFMAKPNHPFMRDLVSNLKSFNHHWFFLPYSTVMFSTGCYYMSAIHMLQENRDTLRVLWGPDNLHRLSGNVTTPLFKHLGSSSWHSYDAAFFNFIGKPSKWIDVISEKFFSAESNKRDASQVLGHSGGFSWYMISWCTLGLIIGVFVGMRMQGRRYMASTMNRSGNFKTLRRPRRTSFGTNPKQSIWSAPMYKTREHRRAMARFAAQISHGRYWKQLASANAVRNFVGYPPRSVSPNGAESDTSYGSETTLEGGASNYRGSSKDYSQLK